MVAHNITPRTERWRIYHSQGGVTSPLDFTTWVTGDQVAQVWTAFSESAPPLVRFEVTIRPNRGDIAGVSLNKNILPSLWKKGNRITREVLLRDGTTWQIIFDGFLIDSDYDRGERVFGTATEPQTANLEIGDIIALRHSRRPPAEDPTFTTSSVALSGPINNWLTEYDLPTLTTSTTGNINHPIDYVGDIPITEHIHRILFGHECAFLYADQLGQLHSKPVDLAPTAAKLTQPPRDYVSFVNQPGDSEQEVGEVIVTGTYLDPVPYRDPDPLFERFDTDLGPITITTSRTRTTELSIERGPRGAYLGAYEDPTVTESPPVRASGESDAAFSARQEAFNEKLHPFFEDTVPIQARRTFSERIFAVADGRKTGENVTVRETGGSFLPQESRQQASQLKERSIDTITITHSSFIQVFSVNTRTREPRGVFPNVFDPEALNSELLVESRFDGKTWSPYGVDRFLARRLVRRPYDPPSSQRQASSSLSERPPEVEYLEADTEFEQMQIEESCELDFPDGSAAFDRTRTYNLGRYISSDSAKAQELCLVLGRILQGRTQKKLCIWELTDDLLTAPVQPGR